MTDGASEAARASAEQGDEGLLTNEEAQPQVKYGISILELEDDTTVVHVTGTPDLGQLQRLLSAALANLNADITARKVIEALRAEQAKPKIHRP